MTEGGIVAREDAPARTVHWESSSKESFEVVYRYRIDAPYVDTTAPAAGGYVVDAPRPRACDLAEIRPHVRFTPYLKALTNRLVQGVDVR